LIVKNHIICAMEFSSVQREPSPPTEKTGTQCRSGRSLKTQQRTSSTSRSTLF
jgi:hypothetical protein